MAENTIVLAKSFTPLLDEVYKKESVTSDFTGDANMARAGANAKEIVYPQIAVEQRADVLYNMRCMIKGNIDEAAAALETVQIAEKKPEAALATEDTQSSDTHDDAMEDAEEPEADTAAVEDEAAVQTVKKNNQPPERKSRMDKGTVLQLLKDGYSVRGTVRGGEGNMHHYTIEGFPYSDYSRRKTLLRVRRQQLIDRDEKLAELETQVEHFLSELADSRLRQMIEYRYIENMSWVQVADRMGGNNTADGCRKMVDRFLNNAYS